MIGFEMTNTNQPITRRSYLMQRHHIATVSLLLALALITSACAPQSIATQAPQAAQPTNTSASPVTGGEISLDEEVDPAKVQGDIVTAGSSTVFPLSEAVVNLFEEEGYPGQATVDSIGSGAGFERFCAGETDIANASRAIKDSEVQACKAIGNDPLEFRVGTDAIAIVVHPENDFLTDVTSEELAMIFSDKAETWADINPEYPVEPIKRYAPGTDSGTYDFFIEVISTPANNDDSDAAMAAFQSASNLQQSEDDNVLVQGVEGDLYSIGFFGFAYYQEQQDKLKAISVDGVKPTADTAEDGSYALARPLYIYSSASIMQKKPQVASFIQFYLNRVNEVIEDVGYFPASDQALEAARQSLVDALQ
jgi:phosphate transport system substrate-binding protein